jgi:hypothetical protein
MGTGIFRTVLGGEFGGIHGQPILRSGGARARQAEEKRKTQE